jgi:hypothetical protein
MAASFGTTAPVADTIKAPTSGLGRLLVRNTFSNFARQFTLMLLAFIAKSLPCSVALAQIATAS